MKDLFCPYCGCDVEETTGVNNQWESGLQIVPINKVHRFGYKIGIAFECKECDREFFLNEDVFLTFNMPEVQPFGGKSDIVRKAAEAKGMPVTILNLIKSRHVPIVREPIFKCHKYHIKVDGDYGIAHPEFLQDMAFAFGYKWEMNGQKYLEKKFEYLSIEPETKRLWYNLSDPGNNLSNGDVDLRGFMQVLNGIEPTEKPDEIEVDGNPVEFHKDGAVTIESRDGDSCCIPYATLFDILETAKETINFPDDPGKSNE